MAVTINNVDLSPPQLRAIAELTPIAPKMIEQVKDYGTRVTVRTYVRVGKGATLREWLVRRNGEAIPNPTPGRGTPRR